MSEKPVKPVYEITCDAYGPKPGDLEELNGLPCSRVIPPCPKCQGRCHLLFISPFKPCITLWCKACGKMVFHNPNWKPEDNPYHGRRNNA